MRNILALSCVLLVGCDAQTTSMYLSALGTAINDQNSSPRPSVYYTPPPRNPYSPYQAPVYSSAPNTSGQRGVESYQPPQNAYVEPPSYTAEPVTNPVGNPGAKAPILGGGCGNYTKPTFESPKYPGAPEGQC